MSLHILLIIHYLLSLPSFPLKITQPQNGVSLLCLLCSFYPRPHNVISLALSTVLRIRLNLSHPPVIVSVLTISKV
uniref:Uncharacterized protein n=1 Tax=Brassica oleracea var. oleracea TaxID=109376 RepID=A0A0D2ZXT7_BRAOL